MGFQILWNSETLHLEFRRSFVSASLFLLRLKQLQMKQKNPESSYLVVSHMRVVGISSPPTSLPTILPSSHPCQLPTHVKPNRQSHLSSPKAKKQSHNATKNQKPHFMLVPVSAARISGQENKNEAKTVPTWLIALERAERVSGNRWRRLGQMTFGLGLSPPHPKWEARVTHALSNWAQTLALTLASAPAPPVSWSSSSSLAMPAIRFYCHRFSFSYVLWHVVRLLPLDRGIDNNDVA